VPITPDQREVRKLKKHLKDLTGAVMGAIARIDALMKQPDSNLRGKQIAEVTNALEMTNDGARYFGLGVNFRTDKKQR